MNLRDKLNTKEGYEELIEISESYIEEEKIEIAQLKQDDSKGIQRFPKSNKEIIKSTYDTLFRESFELICGRYSKGESLEFSLEPFPDTLFYMFNSWNAESGYVQMVNILSISSIFTIEDSEFDKLVSLVERDNVNDYLIDFLIRYRKPHWQQTEKFLWNKPYKGMSEIVEFAKDDKEKALERLKKYLREWYRSLETKTHESKHNIHTGYWCWEAGAIAKILDLDDSSLKDQAYYPYDMVHWND